MTATGFDSTPISSILFVGLELSKSVWKLAFASTDQQNLRIRDVAAGDLGQFQREIREAKRKVDLPEDGQVVTCFEAGRDGFWIHRALDSPCLGFTVPWKSPGRATTSSNPLPWRPIVSMSSEVTSDGYPSRLPGCDCVINVKVS